MYFELYLLDKCLSLVIVDRCAAECAHRRPKLFLKLLAIFRAPFHPEINFLLFIFKFPYQTIGPQLTGI
jgi:hypothetical protein